MSQYLLIDVRCANLDMWENLRDDDVRQA